MREENISLLQISNQPNGRCSSPSEFTNSLIPGEQNLTHSDREKVVLLIKAWHLFLLDFLIGRNNSPAGLWERDGKLERPSEEAPQPFQVEEPLAEESLQPFQNRGHDCPVGLDLERAHSRSSSYYVKMPNKERLTLEPPRVRALMTNDLTGTLSVRGSFIFV